EDTRNSLPIGKKRCSKLPCQVYQIYESIFNITRAAGPIAVELVSDEVMQCFANDTMAVYSANSVPDLTQ
ncbi:hypothetical protein U1Q18_050218, partial [Sarracenia purpurea var. burkii]